MGVIQTTPWRKAHTSVDLLFEPSFYEPRIKTTTLRLICAAEKILSSGFRIMGNSFGDSTSVDDNNKYEALSVNNSIYIADPIIWGYDVSMSKTQALDSVVGWRGGFKPITYAWTSSKSPRDDSWTWKRPANFLLYNITKRLCNHYMGVNYHLDLDSQWSKFIDTALTKHKQQGNANV
jgi:hypothetical protein